MWKWLSVVKGNSSSHGCWKTFFPMRSRWWIFGFSRGMQPVIFCNRVPKVSKFRFHQAKKTFLFAENLIENCQITKSSVKFRSPFQNLCPRFWRPCFVSAPEICLFMRSQNISKAAFFLYIILRKFYINWHHSTTIPGYSSCLIEADVCKKWKRVQKWIFCAFVAGQ